MGFKRCEVFEIHGERFGVLGSVNLKPGKQFVDVVRVADDDWTTPLGELPVCIEVDEGEEGPFCMVRSNSTVLPSGRQTRSTVIEISIEVVSGTRLTAAQAAVREREAAHRRETIDAAADLAAEWRDKAVPVRDEIRSVAGQRASELSYRVGGVNVALDPEAVTDEVLLRLLRQRAGEEAY